MKKEESTISYSACYGGVKQEILSIEDFLKLEPVPVQRDSDMRKNKLAKDLKKRILPTQLEVAIVELPKDYVNWVNSQDSGEKRNSQEVLNGNTRSLVWKQRLAPIPDYVKATYYSIPDEITYDENGVVNSEAIEEYVQDLYYSFDSQAAVEKTPHKITGLYRKHGLYVSDGKIAKGGITKSFQTAFEGYTYTDEDGNEASLRRTNDIRTLDQGIALFKDEIETLSRIGTSSVTNSAWLASALMALKKYGTNNERLLTGLRNFKKCFIEHESQSGYDAITFAHTLLKTNANSTISGAIGKTDAISLRIQMNHYLYLIDKFLDRELIKVTPQARVVKNVYESYWNE